MWFTDQYGGVQEEGMLESADVAAEMLIGRIRNS